jgi:hypothetical protein
LGWSSWSIETHNDEDEELFDDDARRAEVLLVSSITMLLLLSFSIIDSLQQESPLSLVRDRRVLSVLNADSGWGRFLLFILGKGYEGERSSSSGFESCTKRREFEAGEGEGEGNS